MEYKCLNYGQILKIQCKNKTKTTKEPAQVGQYSSGSIKYQFK